MQCISCGYEPIDDLLRSPCTQCGKEWVDTFDYVAALSKGLNIRTVLDIGCGMKGVIAQHHWEKVQPIEYGYACDRWMSAWSASKSTSQKDDAVSATPSPSTGTCEAISISASLT